MNYTVHLVFEENEDPEDNHENYCRAVALYTDGTRREWSVWTLDYFQDILQYIYEAVEEEGYATLPDLLVPQLEQKTVEDALKNILPQEETAPL